MIQMEGVFNFYNYQVQVWKTVEEKGPTTWYTHVIVDENDGAGELDYFIGVSGTSRGRVLLETGKRFQKYLDSKQT